VSAEVAGFVFFWGYPLLMIPSIGRIVHYTLTEQDAEQINRRRADAQAQIGWHREHKTGAVVHIGNSVAEGDVYPLLITRTWGDQEDSAVNGQVFLDGSDTLWVTSVTQGTGARQWVEPPRASRTSLV
jgi:hypothetical protein